MLQLFPEGFEEIELIVGEEYKLLKAAMVEGGVDVVDRMSGPYLGGAVIDFVDTIEKQGFTIDNPNAQGSCACGDSFH